MRDVFEIVGLLTIVMFCALSFALLGNFITSVHYSDVIEGSPIVIEKKLYKCKEVKP